MASGDGFRSLLARAKVDLPPATWQEPEDLVRYGMESMVADEAGHERVLRSSGRLRLHGEGVEGHSIDLEDVGAITMEWQRSVTSIGAALEDIRSSRGPLPHRIRTRTRLRLTSAPSPGSIVLHVEPKSDPLSEVEPTGALPLVDQARPLADRSADALIDLLASVVRGGLVDGDDLSARIRGFGPRVASAVHALAKSLSDADVAVDVAWREPGTPTRRASLSANDARWLQRFIEAKELTTEIETFRGVAATVSDRERWLIETPEGVEKVVATQLGLDEVRRVRTGDYVALKVLTRTTTQPDGTVTTRREALELLDVQPPGASGE